MSPSATNGAVGRGGGAFFLIEANRLTFVDLLSSKVKTLASTSGGSGTWGGDYGGPTTRPSNPGPQGLAVDPDTGDVYFTDSPSNTIKKLDAKSGVIVTVSWCVEGQNSGMKVWYKCVVYFR